LGALGSFAAAAAALWIATTDRKQREQERDDADRKQAGLVRLKTEWSELGTPRASLRVSVKNYGKLPIIDVAVTGWRLDGEDVPAYSWGSTKEAVLPYNATTHPADVFILEPMTRATRIAMQGEPYPSNMAVAGNQLQTRPSVSNLTDVTVTIEFTDAVEKRWRRSNKRLVERA
jgi:hypothetical protein